jgi:DNA-binding NtrC family response regulator
MTHSIPIEPHYKGFRSDLFFRLEVIPFHIPPLRERREDILPLIRHFLGRLNRSYETKKRFSSEAIDCLLGYDYPGNIRELENIIERLVVVGMSDLIGIEDIPKYILEKPSSLKESPYTPVRSKKLNFSIASFIEQSDEFNQKVLAFIDSAGR